MKIIKRTFLPDYKPDKVVVIKEGINLNGAFSDLLNRAYSRADLNSRNEPNLTRLSRKSFQLYLFGLLTVFELKSN